MGTSSLICHNMRLNTLAALFCFFNGTLAGFVPNLRRTDNWVDICKDGFSHENDCCHLNKNATVDEGMLSHEYLIMGIARKYEDQSMRCLMNGMSDSDHHSYQLLTLETRKEYNCVMQYLAKEKTTMTSFYIGLEAGQDQKNIFEWKAPIDPDNDGKTLTFGAWAPSAPAGKGECVQVMKSGTMDGLWVDTPCTTLLPAICERFSTPTTTTTSTTVPTTSTTTTTTSTTVATTSTTTATTSTTAATTSPTAATTSTTGATTSTTA